jgi:hypothetical protein
VLKDNVVWSSTEAGFPLCTFRSFGTDSRSDGSIAMNLTSSAKDEARVFKSSADLKASLLATLGAYAAAIARTKASIMKGGMHPEAAFTLTSAPAPALPSPSAATPTPVPEEAAVSPPAATPDTQEALVSPTSTPSAAGPKNKNVVVVAKKKVVSMVGGPRSKRLTLQEDVTGLSRRLTRSDCQKELQEKFSDLFSMSGASAHV